MKQRVLTSLAIAPVVLAALLAPSTAPLAILLATVVYLSSLEIRRLLKARFVRSGLIALTASSAAFASAVPSSLAIAALGAALAALGVLSARLTGEGPGRAGWAPAPLTAGWVLGPAISLLALRQEIAAATLLAILPVWAGDVSGMLVGRAIGRRPLAPRVSPKKTREGAAANLSACVLVGLALSPLLPIDWRLGAAAGLACGILGQAGDLFESDLKRRIGVKDSGDLLPGHGGLLDRIDGLLFAIPVVALLVLGFR